MPRLPKHPFHWDTYNKLYDRFTPILESEDKRIYPEVQRQLAEARHLVWMAWNLQCQMEREAGLRE